MIREEAFKTLKENLCALCAYGSQNMELCDIRSCDNRDAIKALEQESRKGHWKSTIDGKPICSECGFVSESEDGYFVSHYCPNCGADMREKEECI